MKVVRRAESRISFGTTPLGRQLAWGTGLILAFLLVATGINHLHLGEIHRTCKELEENLSEQRILAQLSFQMAACQEWERRILGESPGSAGYRQSWDAWQTASQALLDTLGQQGPQLILTNHSPPWKTWQKWAQEYVENVFQWVEASAHSTEQPSSFLKGAETTRLSEQTTVAFLKGGQQAWEHLRRAVETERDRLQTAAQSSGHRLQFLLVRHTRWTAAWAVVALGCVGIASLWTSKYILGRVRRLTEAARRLADSQDPLRLETASQDELGQLAGHLNRLTEKLVQIPPLLPEDVGPVGSPPSEKQQKPDQPGKVRGRVLLAEDGPENQRLISTILRKAGLEVDIVADGQQAVQRVLQRMPNTSPYPHYDLILMDMLMPDLDGFQATQRLRQEGYQGPILAITALSETYTSAQCLEAGCTDYLTKPFDREKILRLVAKYLPGGQPSEPPAAEAVPSP